MNNIKNLFKLIFFLLKRRDHIYVKSPSLVSVKSVLSEFVDIGRNTKFSGCIGDFSFVGDNCNLPLTKIGKYCSIANDVHLIAGTHPISDFVSTSPFFYSNRYPSINSVRQENKFQEFKYTDERKKFLLEIGHDVWIGQRVSILNGVKIGSGSIIGACSLVTRDVPPYSIVVGTPARVIRYRFDRNIIDKLSTAKWWEKDKEWIIDNISSFSDVNTFLDCLLNEGASSDE